MVPEKIFVLVTKYYYLLFGDVIIKTSDTLKFKYLKHLPLPASVRGSIIQGALIESLSDISLIIYFYGDGIMIYEIRC